MRYFIFVGIMVLILSSCGNNEDNLANSAAQVVESSAPSLGLEAWTLSENPILALGVIEGEPHLQFYRVFSALQLENGFIVVSNSGTQELRFFDQNGDYLKSVGRSGQGPGDFGALSSMRLYQNTDGTFTVNDNSNKRVQVFDSNGELVSVHVIERIPDAGNPTLSGIFTDGGVLLWSVFGNPALQGNPGELIQKENGFHRLKPDFTYDGLIFKVPSRPRFVSEYNGRRSFPQIPLTSDPIYTTDSDNGALFSTGVEPVISRVDSGGNNTHKFVWNLPRVETASIWERYKQEYYIEPLQNSPDQLGLYLNMLSKDLPIPEFVPALTEINVDQEGNIWVKRFDLPWDENFIWDVLDSDGNWLTTVTLPGRFNITDIGSDYVLGYTSQNGFPQVIKYELMK